MTAPTFARVGHNGGTLTFESVTRPYNTIRLVGRTAPPGESSDAFWLLVVRAAYLLRRARLRPYLQARKARGATPVQPARKCIECNGRGTLTQLGGDWGATPDRDVECWACHGTGVE